MIAGWWLSHQQLSTKPWLEEGLIADRREEGPLPPLQAKIGLGVFLAVVGSLFALVVSAYFMRKSVPDWRSVPLPATLWFNSGVLILSSVVLQLAQIAVRRGDRDGAVAALLAGGVSAAIFLIGQLLVWRQLRSAGYFLASNPANSFFYLMTGLHGVHLAGGLVALCRTIAKALGGLALPKLRVSVELCVTYWHFLLVVWLILLGLMTGSADDFISICRQAFS
jgi:cytochrome c oxidase subunit 3